MKIKRHFYPAKSQQFNDIFKNDEYIDCIIHSFTAVTSIEYFHIFNRNVKETAQRPSNCVRKLKRLFSLFPNLLYQIYLMFSLTTFIRLTIMNNNRLIFLLYTCTYICSILYIAV